MSFRGIEWSLRALASMRALRLFLRARAVIRYVLRAASTLKNRDQGWRAARSLFIEKQRFAPSNQADIIQPIPAAYSQFCLVGDDVKLRHVS